MTDDWQTQQRGTLNDEYQLYEAHMTERYDK